MLLGQFAFSLSISPFKAMDCYICYDDKVQGVNKKQIAGQDPNDSYFYLFFFLPTILITLMRGIHKVYSNK